MKNKLLYTLRSKIIAYILIPLFFLIVISGLIQAYGIPFTKMKGSINEEKLSVFNKLNAIADSRKEKLENWITDRRHDIDIIADNEMIGISLLNLQNEIEKSSKNNRDDKKTWEKIINSGVSKRLNHTLELIVKTYGYYERISIIDISTSKTILSSDENKIGSSIDIDTHPDISELLGNPSKTFVNFRKSKSYEHTHMLIYRSISTPIDLTKRVFVVLAKVNLQNFSDPIIKSIRNIGKTGEVVLVNDEALNLTNLKFNFPDGTKPDILGYAIKSIPAQLASEGKDGFIESTDYRGVPVIAAYRSISITPDSHIGLVVKQDKKESLENLKARVMIAIIINTLVFSILFIIAVLIVKKITDPIGNLKKASEQAQSGNYSIRVPLSTGDEIGVLSQSFNTMLDTIEDSHKSLESEVGKRTSELNQTNRKFLDEIERHHKTMRSLKEKEDHLQAIMDYSPSMIYLKDKEGKYILVNNKFKELPLLNNTHRIIGTTASDYMPFDTADEIKNAEKEIIETGKVFKREMKSSAPDSQKWFSTIKFPLRNSSGEIYGICCFTDDITERKKAEILIKESESQLRAIVDNSPALIFIKDIEGKYLMINSVYEKIFNITQAEIKGKTDFELFPEEIAQKLTDNDRKVVEEKKAIKEEEVVEQDDGCHTYISVKFPFSDTAGKIYAVCGISTDITKTKSKGTELEKLATAIAQTEECIVITDSNAMIEYVNPAFEKVTGYSISEAIGQNPRILSSGEHDKKFYANLWNTITSGKTWKGEFINKRRDGSIYNEDATISPVFDAKNKIINYVAVKKDTSQEKSREEQLLQAQKMESVGKLAGGVAHDFNNILVGILGYSELIIRGIKNDIQIRKYAEEIRGAGERAASLTRQLLAFSRKQIIEPKIIGLNQLIGTFQNMLSRIIGENIQIALKLKQSGLGTIKADPDQISQVLLNLSVNARDAIEKTGKIIIKTSNVNLNNHYFRDDGETVSGKYVILSVADTGKGMDSITLKKIYEPFFTTKKEGQGTGLGLSTVYGIVKQSNGYISVHSKLGKGTVFKIYLPRVDTKIAEESTETVVETSLIYGQEKILIVEDEETVRELACEIVSSKGYITLSAANPEEAIKMAGNGIGHIDLLLTDLIMPEMDGVELSAKLKKINPSLKILIMSGYSDKEFQRNGGIKENMPYIQKPFSPSELLKRIRSILDETDIS